MRISLSVLLFAALGWLSACSDDSQVQEQQSAPQAEETKKDNACGEQTALQLVEETNTFWSAPVQGILRSCGGCHSGPGTQANIDLTDYDRMLQTFSTEKISINRILQQVQSNHQGMKEEAEAIITAWAANSYARGTKDGASDDSPFFDGAEGDNGIDLDGFDPFADLDATKTECN